MQHEPLKKMVGVKTKVIWDKYQELLKEAQEMESQRPKSTEDVAKKAKMMKAIEATDNIDVSVLETKLNELLSSISEAKEAYSTIIEAVQAKRDELKVVHNLEEEANSLVAIVTAKDQLVAERETKAKEILEEAELKAGGIIELATDKAKALEELARQKAADDEKKRLREQEQWNYDFARSKRDKEGKLQDILAEQMKQIQIKSAEVASREALAEEKDTQIQSLKNELENLISQREEDIQAAAEKAKKSAMQSANIAQAMDKKTHEAEMSISQASIKNLEAQVAELKENLAIANRNVNNANERVSEMAAAALRSGADANTVAELHKAAALGGKK
jgi:cell division septum initiation protein DivIVA